MGDECVRRLALSVAEQAFAGMASPTASSGEKLKSYSFALGIRWRKHLSKAASAHVMSGLVGRGLANPATNQMARALRTGLHEVWRAAGGQVDADSSSWWTFVEEKGRIDETSRQGRDETITRLQEWLVSNLMDS